MLETVRRPAVVATILEKGPRVELARLIYPVSIGATVALGTYVRAVRTFAYDFPLNDGGLFFTMVQDLQRAHYQLPGFTSYNAAGIPFTYSPFGLYVAALLNDIMRISLTNIFRFLPLLIVTLTMLAFFLLARSVLKSRPVVLAALVSFALIPRSFIWLIMGGGITRAFGFLFALLALYTAHEMYEREEIGLVIPTALFSGLTILSHLETGTFLAYSMVIFFVCYGAHRKGLIHACLVAVGTAVVIAPWFITVVAYHGLAPFQAANQTGSSIFTGPADRQNIRNMIHVFGLGTNEPYFWLLGTFGLLGALIVVVRSFASVQRREYVLPALPIWWLVIVLLDNRAADTYTTIPVALCAGVGIAEMVIPALSRAMGDLCRHQRQGHLAERRRIRMVPHPRQPRQPRHAAGVRVDAGQDVPDSDLEARSVAGVRLPGFDLPRSLVHHDRGRLRLRLCPCRQRLLQHLVVADGRLPLRPRLQRPRRDDLRSPRQLIIRCGCDDRCAVVQESGFFRALCEALSLMWLGIAGRNGIESEMRSAIRTERRLLSPLHHRTVFLDYTNFGRATKAGLTPSRDGATHASCRAIRACLCH
ncbi:MAG: hypothetical protein LC793_11320 [Thermomicrobia bacterium]|nr:hypothetical protein [Thermomicrobia bacterium]